MNRIIIWLPAILIPSVLLLGSRKCQAVNPTGKANLKAQASQRSKGIDTGTLSTLPKVDAQTSGNVKTGRSDFNTLHDVSQHEGSSDLPAWLQAVATIGLLGFAFWQMRLISRSTTATENAAGAAAENAKAAKDAAEATERYVGM